MNILNMPITEITEDRWFEMLEVLPPEKWKEMGSVEIFRCSEYYTEGITAHFIKIRTDGVERFLECLRRTTEDYAQIAQDAHEFVSRYEKGGWHPSWIEIGEPIGEGLSVIEFQSDDDEWHNFDVMLCEHNAYRRIVFGGFCNAGFIESGFIEFDYTESIGNALQELLEDLEVYYNYGPDLVSKIVCTERM